MLWRQELNQELVALPFSTVKDVWFGVLVLKNLHSSKEDGLEIPLQKTNKPNENSPESKEKHQVWLAEGNNSESNI